MSTTRKKLEQEVARISNLLHGSKTHVFRARCTTAVWRYILLNEYDRPVVRGSLVTLIGRNLGAGVYEITYKMGGQA